METWRGKETRFQGKIFSVQVGEVTLDDGQVAVREMVHHAGGVAVIPLLGEQVILIRQFRVAVGKEILELPAGRLEGDERPEARAQAELEEETGYRAGKLRLASAYYSSAGFTNERMYIFLATGLEAVGQKLEFDERIELVKMSVDDVRSKLAAGEFDDAKTIIGLRELLAFLDTA